MKALLQRVTQASVEVDGSEISSIAAGWLLLLGVTSSDTPDDIDYLTDKCVHLRAFSDADGKMNLSIQDAGAEILVVSQFTLYADCRKGRRPSFTNAAPPEQAKELYEIFCTKLRTYNLKVSQGVFGAHMQIRIVNDGPVTILLDSKDR